MIIVIMIIHDHCTTTTTTTTTTDDDDDNNDNKTHNSDCYPCSLAVRISLRAHRGVSILTHATEYCMGGP